MKPNVLVATQDRSLRDAIRENVADILTVSGETATVRLSGALKKRDYRALVLDTRMPDLDELSLLHTLRHHGDPDLFLLTIGPFYPLTTMAAQEMVRCVPLPKSPARVWETLREIFDPSSSRTIREVRYQPRERTFFVAFRNGKPYELSRGLIEADDGTSIVGEPEVIHGGEAFRVHQKSGNVYEVAWDFVLYHQEPSYRYYKGKADQRETEGSRAERIASRIHRERETRGWSLGELASRTGMQVPNLSRLESGKHVPSLETLERVAEALGVRVAELVAA